MFHLSQTCEFATPLPLAVDKNIELEAQHEDQHGLQYGQRPDQLEAKEGNSEVEMEGESNSEVEMEGELDYEIDQMTDYVCEMGQGIFGLFGDRHIAFRDNDSLKSVIQRSGVPSEVRNWVFRQLSTFRLESSVILLGLNYLAKRMSMLNTSTNLTENEVWCHLAIALLLGTKFLDDRSSYNIEWSEVSGIPLLALNYLETDWLFSIDYNLYVDPVTDTDFHLWLRSWEAWRDAKKQERSATLDELAQPTTLASSTQFNLLAPLRPLAPPAALIPLIPLVPLTPNDPNIQHKHLQRTNYFVRVYRSIFPPNQGQNCNHSHC